MDQSSQTGGHVSDKDLMPWDFYTLKEAMAKCNSNIPSLFTLVVESIKAFVNPGIKELEVKLLDDNADKLTHNNELRCIAEDSIEENIRMVSDEVAQVQATLSNVLRNANDHKEQVMDLIDQTRSDILEEVSCDNCNNNTLYGRVKELQTEVTELSIHMSETKVMVLNMQENIEALRRFCEGGVSVTKPQRKRKRKDIE